MKIEKNKVVSMHYTLKDSAGEVIDTSSGKSPLAFIHGLGMIIPGLEKELDGKATGDKLKVEVEPAQGYGERDDNLIQKVPREQFEGAGEIKEGMQFQVDTEMGPLIVVVVAEDDKEVTIDGNHPLAGVKLFFDVEIAEVRDATKEELDHGHVHGPGGHDH
mgnify:CR=1 FL=1|tara:strand:+ start:96534 stop:97016 length:483 start_codon:yes stop_codon:yes gene_type:complete